MTQFTSIISEYEVSIKAMTEYLEQITQARPIHEVESEVFALALAVGHAAMKAFVERIGTGDVGLIHVDEAGNERKRHDIRPLTYRSIFGKVEIHRSYYYHPDREGLCPLDAALSLPERSCSYLLQNWMMRFGAKETYYNGCDDLKMLLGIKIPKRMAEAIVAEGSRDVASFREQLAPPSEEGSILVIQVDGKGIRMVKPKTDEPKEPKIRLTKGQKRNKKKMANVFTVYTINPVAEYSPDPIEMKVYAFMGTKRAAFEKFAPEAKKRGYGCSKTLFLSDGDLDLADLQVEFFPRG